ncbi:MAG: shikimate kinase [Bacillota bacterium]|nr:shikimate kinase [Bacillota bacterium]
MKNISLIGFMACGKSTIGRVLAHEMKYSFVDIDKKIEKRQKMKISKIFDTHGEEYFRKVETETLEKYLLKEKTVISTGGGIVLNPKNVDILYENSFVVFLDVPFDILAERAAANNQRPLFREREAAYKLWSERYPIYRSAAHFIINENEDIILKTVHRIMAEYYNYMKNL